MRTIKFLFSLYLAIAMMLVPVLSFSESEIRPLPIDLSGGAPYTAVYSSDLMVYEDPSIRLERSLRTHSEVINRD